jgi:hypothetical protein
VLHASVAAARRSSRTVDSAAFEFIAGNRQIEAVHAFLASLASALTR